MLQHMEDSWHTQNIQINKVIGKNEKYVIYFMEKTKWTFWPTQYVHVRKFKLYGRYKIKSEILFALPSPSFSWQNTTFSSKNKNYHYVKHFYKLIYE